MSVPSDRERMLRLETRAKEADVTLRQLKSYVQLLKQKTGSLTTFFTTTILGCSVIMQVVPKQLPRRWG